MLKGKTYKRNDTSTVEVDSFELNNDLVEKKIVKKLGAGRSVRYQKVE